MVLQSDRERLRSAWRALSGSSQGDGWRTIPIDLGKNCPLLAGRYFPDDKEALLVGFKSVRTTDDKLLPQGHGFKVEIIKHQITGSAEKWISLARQSAGNLDMFAMMAEDIISLVTIYDHANDEILFQLFLGRIKAWQEFMESDKFNVLGPEAEVGLFGEILVLRDLLFYPVPTAIALDAWRGPLEGLQDFMIGSGAVEVKSTVASSSFPVTIGSLEQLDDSLVQPLYLAAIKLSLDDSGKRLPELVEEVRYFLANDSWAQGVFDKLVLQAGFLWAFADRYERHFLHIGTSIFPVTNAFPHLKRGNVDVSIRKVRYELDLDLIDVTNVELKDALMKLGVV